MTTRVTEGARGDAFFSSRAAALRLSRLPLTKYEEKVRLLAVCINSFFVIFIFPQLMPLLIQSLSCEEQTLQQSTLQTMYSLVLDAPEIVTRHVTSLVPMFLGLSKFQLSMVSGTTGGGIPYYDMATNRDLYHESDHILPSYKTSFRSCLFRLAATHENIKGLSLNGVWLACVASISVRFRSKNEERESKTARKNGASKRAGRSFFAPKPNGNAATQARV